MARRSGGRAARKALREAPLAEDARAVLERLDVRQVVFGAVDPSAEAADLRLEDAEQAYADWFERHDASAALVRPDQVVFGVARDGRDASTLLRALGSALG